MQDTEVKWAVSLKSRPASAPLSSPGHSSHAENPFGGKTGCVFLVQGSVSAKTKLSHMKSNFLFFSIFLPVALDILQIANLWPLENLTKLQLDNNFIEKIEGLETLVHLVWLGEIQAEEGGCLHRCKAICDKPGCHLPSQTRLIGVYPGKAVSCLCVSLFDCQMSKCLSIRAAKQSFKCLKTEFNTFGVAGTGTWGFKAVSKVCIVFRGDFQEYLWKHPCDLEACILFSKLLHAFQSLQPTILTPVSLRG